MGQDIHEYRRLKGIDDPNPMLRRGLPSIFRKILGVRKARILDWRKRKAHERKWHHAQTFHEDERNEQSKVPVDPGEGHRADSVELYHTEYGLAGELQDGRATGDRAAHDDRADPRQLSMRIPGSRKRW